MTRPIGTISALIVLLLTTACSEQTGNNNAYGSYDSPLPTSSPISADGDAAVRFARFAACSSTMTALARLYRSIATQSQGAEVESMNARAAQREAAATAFRDFAVSQGATIGRSAADVDRIAKETDARHAAAAEQQPMEQFAVALGKEGDACQALAQTAS